MSKYTTGYSNDYVTGYDAGYKDAEVVCQNSQEASGQKDHSHADSRARKTEILKERYDYATRAKPAIYNPASKLATILNDYKAKHYVSVFQAGDVRSILEQNWFEVQAYAHAIHDSEGETK
jgi:hypothetical protein